MRTGFHAAQLNPTVRGVRVKILRPECLAFHAFLYLLCLYEISTQLCSLSYAATSVDFVGSFRLTWAWQQRLWRQNCVLNSLEQGINHNINLFVEHSMHF